MPCSLRLLRTLSPSWPTQQLPALFSLQFAGASLLSSKVKPCWVALSDAAAE